MFCRNLAHKCTAFVSVHQRSKSCSLCLSRIYITCCYLRCRHWAYCCSSLKNHMTYVHLLLKLYSFGAIWSHSCSIRLQLRLCMHIVQCPPTPVPNPFTSVLSLMQYWHCAYLISWSHWTFACLYNMLKVLVCLSRLVRSTDSATYTRGNLDCPWALEEVEEHHKKQMVLSWIQHVLQCKCLACDVLVRSKSLSNLVWACQTLSSAKLPYAQCGMLLMSCICVQLCTVVARPQLT